jgi:ketosteroid isomerase-like protein
MKRILVIFLLVSLAAGTMSGQTSATKRTKRAPRPAASSGEQPLNDAEAGQQLSKRLQQILNAWSMMDPDAAAKYYAKDADLVFFDLTPLQYKGWDDYYLGTKKLFQNYQSLNIRLNEDANVHYKGDLAYATATWNVLGTLNDGTQQKLDLRWTVILERRNGEWVVVHEHVSAPLTEAMAAPSKPAAPEPKKPADPLK